ncbi:MAG: hypothetical protein WD011_03640, partial [Nitriliruptoraceae bacterium]
MSAAEPGADAAAAPRPAVGAVGAWAAASALAAVASTTIATPTGGHPAVWLAIVAGSAAGVFAMIMRARRGADSLGIAPLVVTAIVVVTAVAARAATTDDGLLPQLADHGGRAAVELTIAREPRVDGASWRAIVDVERVDGHATRERAALVADGPVPALGTR